MGAHVAPPFVLLKTPPWPVPTYAMLEFEGSTTTDSTSRSLSPVLLAVQLAAASVLLKTPPPKVPA